MEYRIKKAGRTVNLNDELVEEYCKYDELRDAPFMIVIHSEYGMVPTEEEVSMEELSVLCNEVLLGELKALAMLPKAVQVITEHMGEWNEASRTRKYIKIKLKE